jgi:TolA-binding protein
MAENQATISRLEAIIVELQGVGVENQAAISRHEATIGELQGAGVENQATISRHEATIGELQSTIATQQVVIVQLQGTMAENQVKNETTLSQLKGIEAIHLRDSPITVREGMRCLERELCREAAGYKTRFKSYYNIDKMNLVVVVAVV